MISVTYNIKMTRKVPTSLPTEILAVSFSLPMVGKSFHVMVDTEDGQKVESPYFMSTSKVNEVRMISDTEFEFDTVHSTYMLHIKEVVNVDQGEG